MRDPLDYLKDRVEGRVYRKVHNAKAKVQGTIDGAGRKLVHSGEDAVARAAGKKKAGGQKDAAKKKKKMGWWPFGGDDEGVETPSCHSCGKEVDASWEVCPYCRTGLGDAPAAGQAPVPQAPGAPVPQAAPGGGGSQRTVAIDLDELKAPRREVVGWLVVMSGAQKGIDYRIYTGMNTIGAAADNDIVVTDEYLSSRHSKIRYEEGRYELIDNDSTNGTYVNDQRVNREELIDNDTIRLGRTELRFKALY